MLQNVLISLAFCVFIAFLPFAIPASHLIFNSKNGKVEHVEDTPYNVRQPHSLHGFINQIQWIDELAELRASVREQQLLIEKHYDKDVPEIERKIQEAYEDCVQGQSFELKPENFQTNYPMNFLHIKKYESNIKNRASREGIYGRFQLGILYIKFGLYKQAIQQLEYVINTVPNCAICMMILGDVLVLDGNFDYALQKFDAAYAIENLELAFKKSSLLRCIKKAQLIEDQHMNLLDTIKDVDSFNKNIDRIKELEDKIEINRASARDRLQAKLAYEYYVYGTISHANCREHTQWIQKDKDRKSLICTVSNWSKYNESLERKKRQRLASMSENASTRTAIIAIKEDEEKWQEKAKVIQLEVRQRRKEWKKYMERLRPFIGMVMDEPQLNPKYPLQQKQPKSALPFFRTSWPSLVECKLAYQAGKFKINQQNIEHENRDLQSKQRNWLQKNDYGLFISPENKGFIVSELLSKYLALDQDELTPLPWEQPYCSGHALDIACSEKLQFINEIIAVKRIKSGEFPPSDQYAERELGDVLYKLIGYQVSDDDNEIFLDQEQYIQKQPPLLSELGQRISNLMQFAIGPKWLAFNLAALYFRFVGDLKETTTCLEAALKFPNYQDIALTQLAQILMRNTLEKYDVEEMMKIERMLGIAMQEGINEPLPYYLMAVFHSIQGQWIMAERLLFQTLQFEPNFQPSIEALLGKKCGSRIMNYKSKTVHDVYPPICCWPNEQDVFCFEQPKNGILTKKQRKRHSHSITTITRCFRAESMMDEPYTTHFIYFRCNTPYTGKSYPAPAYAMLLSPLLFPAFQLRALKEEKIVRKIETEIMTEWRNQNEQKIPVFPLDYGNFSLERIKAHQRRIWPENVNGMEDYFQHKNFEHIVVTEEDMKLLPDDETTTTTTMATIKKRTNDLLNNTEAATMSINLTNSTATDTFDHDVLLEKEAKPQSFRYTIRRNISRKIDVVKFGELQSRADVVRIFDIELPQNLPTPSTEMIMLGKRSAAASSKKYLLDQNCHTQKKSRKLMLEQSVSTWISPTAKGVKLADLTFMDLTFPNMPVLEPVCSEFMLALERDSMLIDLDDLPAYLYRYQLTKFYRPEKALRDTFRSIGMSKSEKVEHVATRLFFAINSVPAADQVHWALSTLASLYWRLKGDPVNAIRCLRHSLLTSPENFKDVPLVSLANIYNQAGFLNSALFTLNKALEIGGQDVVAIHFTLANLLSNIGDFAHALQFYYSTLSLQSNFEPAKMRIASIHCITNGTLLDDGA